MTPRQSACLAGAAYAIFDPVPLLAEEGRVDQVELLEIEPGAIELEVQFVAAHEENARALNITVERGLAPWLQLGAEIEFESEGGQPLSVESIAPQAKIRIVDPASAPIGLGLQASLAIDADGAGSGGELILIAEHLGQDYVLAGNLSLQTQPGDWSQRSISYAARGDWKVLDPVDAGLEIGGTLSGEGQASHFVGPVLGYSLRDDGPVLELGIFAPLTDRAPGWQARVELDWEF